MKEKGPEIFIETLKNGNFITTPVGNIFLAFRMNENASFNIHCEKDKIIIYGAGNGPKKLVIEPLETDRIAIKIVDLKPIKSNEEEIDDT